MANARGPGGRNREATRNAILEATSALFAERGVDGFTVSDVARRGNINRALIYHYFKDRENLIFESIRHIVRRYEEVRSGDGADPLERSIRLHIEHPEIARFLLHLFLTGRPLPTLSGHVYQTIDALKDAKDRHAPAAELDAQLAVIGGWLVQICWSVARQEIARHLGLTVEEADERMIAHLRHSSKLVADSISWQPAETR